MKRGRGQWVPHDGGTQIKPSSQKGSPTEWGILRTGLQTSSKQWLLGNRQRALKDPGTRGSRPRGDIRDRNPLES